MNYKKTAENTYLKFSGIEGNQNIAGDYALEFILKLIKDFKIKNVLEIGLGIGSISDAILMYAKNNGLQIIYTGTEANQYCIEVLPKNVNYFDEINLYSDIEKIESSQRQQFIIVDGSDESLKTIKRLCHENAIIFIEGGRASQVKTLKSLFPNSLYAEIISVRKPPLHGPFNQKWTGGGGLIFTNPTFYQKTYWIKEKVVTFLKRRIRKFV